MQHMVRWKTCLVFGIVGFFALKTPGHSQEPLQKPDLAPSAPATPSAPAPPAVPAGAPAAPAAGSDAKTYVEYGMSNGAKGDLTAAINAFNQAISIDPKYAPAYYNRGFALSLAGKPDDAIASFDQAIQLDPSYKAAFYQRGSLKGQKGDFDAAMADFDKVIILDSKYAPAYYNLGHVEYFKGDLSNALDHINQGLAIAPDFPFSYFIRGLIRHAQGHREDALADFQKSAGLNFPYAAYWIWITEMEGGQTDVARKDLTTLLKRTDLFKPDDWPSQIGNFLLGGISKDDLLARATTGSADESRGRTCEAWFYIGMYNMLSLGAPDKAKDAFTKALATGSKGSEEYIEAGRSLTKAKAQL